MSSEYAIQVKNVSKSFKLPHEQNSSLKGSLINFKKRGYEVQETLKDISFEVKKGEFFGIVGRNGSGKSTLLKIISEIYTPDTGSVTVDGKLTPFIELGVGFNPELSGRDNVFLNGSLLGFSREQMAEMYDDIVEFAELGRFMDQKLKNYSSGMQVRLAFSVAIRANTDILVLDEVLAVGDTAFQQKCYDYFASLKNAGKTVILVSHSMSAVERFCTRALLLESGNIVEIGPSHKIAALYEKLFIDDANEQGDSEGIKKNEKFELNARILQKGKPVKAVNAFEPFDVSVDITSKVDVEHLNVGLNFRTTEGNVVFSQDMRQMHSDVKLTAGQKLNVTFSIENYYTNGKYSVDLVLVNEGSVADKVLYLGDNTTQFQVLGVTEHIHSLFHPPAKVQVKVKG